MSPPGEMPEPADRRFLRVWSLIGLCLILAAALCSEGFHQADEHFQTLEFAGLKLGRTPASELPWEFAARIRGWLQPGLYIALVRVAEGIGIDDPFRQALGLRLFSGLLAWLALVATTCATSLWVPGERAWRWAVRLTWLAFFTPYLAVRTSSESLSTSCFLLGLAAVARREPAMRSLAAAGVLFGLAFQLRFAVGVMVAAVWLWALVGGHLRRRDLGVMALWSLPVFLLAAVVDRWGYGAWVFPPYEYVRANFGQGLAAERFGVMPWYGYVTLGAHGVLASLILLLELGAVAAWLRWPRHLLTAATLPFVVVHCLIAHKELRFLFPIAPFLPTLLVLAVVGSSGSCWPPIAQPAVQGALRLLLGLDLVALIGLTLLPARPEIGFQRFAWGLARERLEAVVLTSDTPWHHRGAPMYFYRPRSLELHRGLRLAEALAKKPSVLVVAGAFADPAAEGIRCETLYRPYPPWLQSLAMRFPVLKLRGWSLHRCRRGPESGTARAVGQGRGASRVERWRDSIRPARPSDAESTCLQRRASRCQQAAA